MGKYPVFNGIIDWYIPAIGCVTSTKLSILKARNFLFNQYIYNIYTYFD